MIDTKQPGVDRRSLFVWGLFCVLVGLIFLVYACASLTAGRGEFVMPLDDVYIHFQYAKQMALGQPYIYNPGLPPTSGATSFLYPYMLAIGYLLGFQGLNLGLWAMLLGMVALACSTWLVYRLLLAFDAPHWLAVLGGILFAVSGPVSWHFMSGMETGWVVLFTVGTLYFLTPPSNSLPVYGEGEQRRVRYVIVFASLLALIRPEGGILAGLAMAALFLQIRGQGLRTRYSLSLLIPILAIGVQPLVNLLLTGSAVASGNAAKSVFGMIPFYWDEVIRRIFDNFVRLWTELLSGSSPREGLYIVPLMLVLAAIGLIFLLRDRQRRVISLMLIGWLLFGTLAISTLDTAFWHFKRYQMPFVALLFPLAGWGMVGYGNVWRWLKRKAGFLRDPHFVMTRNIEWQLNSRIEVLGIFVAVGIAYTLMTSFDFLSKYALNVGYVYQQPLQMARWLEANTPPDAVIAVHDVGMMRYMGGRTTLDMVGLTTPGAADYWRNGPGSVAEFLIQQRPDYIASYGYGHGFGLGMLADTSLYGEPLASFPVDLDPNFNVALAANFQGIYQPDWEKADRASSEDDINIAFQYVSLGFQHNQKFVSSINVAELSSESASAYQWLSRKNFEGFPSEVHEFQFPGWCYHDEFKLLGECFVLDGGRRIDLMETFSVKTTVENDLILITRILASNPGTLDVFVNDQYLATRWIPLFPGNWINIATLVPANQVTTENTIIRIVPNIAAGYYNPYRQWIYQGQYDPSKLDQKPISSFQSGAIVLATAEIDYESGDSQLALNLDWYTDGSAQGDYKVFVHILDDNDQIVAQADTYPGNGTLPPGNWLPGVLRDTIMVDLQNTPPGTYRVAIGMYDPYTFERLQPAGGDDQNRFFIGDVEIE